MKTEVVKILNPEGLNLILGQSHFIKTVEDIYEVMAQVPNAKFGLAFNEASGACKVRKDGNDPDLLTLACENAMAIGAGHIFIIFMRDAYPISVLNALKAVPEVCRIYCATANPVEVVVAETGQGRGILGVIDGVRPKGVEDTADMEWRRKLLRTIGYKR
jgi:uncharacterized protein